ncbi:MAG: translation initiation factor IF-6 [Candidatus Korarchaeum sp.]
MVVLRARVLGGSNLGIYLRVAGRHLLAPRGVGSSLRGLADKLSLKLLEASVYDSRMIGVLTVANSRALLLPSIVSESELKSLRDSLDIEVHALPTFKLTALGNDIVANDYGAVVHPGFADQELEIISKLLGVRVRKGRVGGIPVVGSLVVANNSGCLISPSADDSELKGISDTLGVECTRGTVNDGIIYVRVGLVVCDSGALVGFPTTPMEVETIAEALKIEP